LGSGNYELEGVIIEAFAANEYLFSTHFSNQTKTFHSAITETTGERLAAPALLYKSVFK